ncbi:hypothetical protein CY0110_19497 [Crocosphaera chwakensis CCY0110]|uniref:Uncharacterized protein n=1 Tax=Crocosphaera chwakensis CCY0110 TaxID=391612 RepID=A3IJN1_9CHRO|nr:hypothetical protein CY0110_19497 [Crocosphaera chwakensis CCY0110]
MSVTVIKTFFPIIEGSHEHFFMSIKPCPCRN